MTQVFFNFDLAQAFDLRRLGHCMETPLDSNAAAELAQNEGGDELPDWKSVSGLKDTDSKRYQDFALTIAKKVGIPRGCLDIYLWRPAEDQVEAKPSE